MRKRKTKKSAPRSAAARAAKNGSRDRTVRETWKVSTKGQERTVVTSASSIAAMDKAVLFFAPALKRLADR